MADYTIAVSWSGKDALADTDASKVISGDDFNTEFTTIQTAINSKADIASETLTDTPIAPTAAADTNTTQIATTAYVQTEIGSGKNGYGDRTVGTGDATGGSNGDIHYKVAS